MDTRKTEKKRFVKRRCDRTSFYHISSERLQVRNLLKRSYNRIRLMNDPRGVYSLHRTSATSTQNISLTEMTSTAILRKASTSQCELFQQWNSYLQINWCLLCSCLPTIASKIGPLPPSLTLHPLKSGLDDHYANQCLLQLVVGHLCDQSIGQLVIVTKRSVETLL